MSPDDPSRREEEEEAAQVLSWLVVTSLKQSY